MGCSGQGLGAPNEACQPRHRGCSGSDVYPTIASATALLEGLPTPQSRVLNMRPVGELRVHKVAERIKINPSLVRRIQTQGLLQIRWELESA